MHKIPGAETLVYRHYKSGYDNHTGLAEIPAPIWVPGCDVTTEGLSLQTIAAHSNKIILT